MVNTGAEQTQSKSLELNDMDTLTLPTETEAHHRNSTQIEN